MYDFVHVSIERKYCSEITNNHNLDWKSQVSCSTGEVNPSRIAYWKGLQIKVTNSGNARVNGSLHKFYNDGLHNYDYYGCKELKETYEKLSDELGIPVPKCKIHSLEIGVNTGRGMTNSTTILDSLVMHKSTPYMDVDRKDGRHRVNKHSQYLIKAYDKGHQHSLPYDLTRFELKYLKAQAISTTSHLHLSDLIEQKVFGQLSGNLVNALDDSLIVDVRLFDKLKGDELRELMRYSNPVYWRHLHGLTKTTKRNRYYREREKCKVWSSNYSDLHNTIKNDVELQVGRFYTNGIR